MYYCSVYSFLLVVMTKACWKLVVFRTELPWTGHVLVKLYFYNMFYNAELVSLFVLFCFYAFFFAFLFLYFFCFFYFFCCNISRLCYWYTISLLSKKTRSMANGIFVEKWFSTSRFVICLVNPKLVFFFCLRTFLFCNVFPKYNSVVM